MRASQAPLSTLALGAALLLSSAWGCAPLEGESAESSSSAALGVDPSAPIDEDGPTVRLTQVPGADERLVVDLSYHPAPGAHGPRVVELWLGVGSGMTFESGSALGPAAAAGKLFVARQEEAGLRVVVLSTSDLTPLGPGKIGRLSFTPTGQGPLTLSIQERMPIFAPPEANEGVSLPELLTLSPGGAP